MAIGSLLTTAFVSCIKLRRTVAPESATPDSFSTEISVTRSAFLCSESNSACDCSRCTWTVGTANTLVRRKMPASEKSAYCLLYTSDAADEEDSVDLGGRRIIKKK